MLDEVLLQESSFRIVFDESMLELVQFMHVDIPPLVLLLHLFQLLVHFILEVQVRDECSQYILKWFELFHVILIKSLSFMLMMHSIEWIFRLA